MCILINTYVSCNIFPSNIYTNSELKGLIKENPRCIYDEGISEQTVLHDAVESGDLEIVRFVLDTSENYPPIGDNFLNLRFKINMYFV